MALAAALFQNPTLVIKPLVDLTVPLYQLVTKKAESYEAALKLSESWLQTAFRIPVASIFTAAFYYTEKYADKIGQQLGERGVEWLKANVGPKNGFQGWILRLMINHGVWLTKAGAAGITASIVSIICRKFDSRATTTSEYFKGYGSLFKPRDLFYYTDAGVSGCQFDELMVQDATMAKLHLARLNGGTQPLPHFEQNKIAPLLSIENKEQIKSLEQLLTATLERFYGKEIKLSNALKIELYQSAAKKLTDKEVDEASKEIVLGKVASYTLGYVKKNNNIPSIIYKKEQYDQWLRQILMEQKNETPASLQDAIEQIYGEKINLPAMDLLKLYYMSSRQISGNEFYALSRIAARGEMAEILLSKRAVQLDPLPELNPLLALYDEKVAEREVEEAKPILENQLKAAYNNPELLGRLDLDHKVQLYKMSAEKLEPPLVKALIEAVDILTIMPLLMDKCLSVPLEDYDPNIADVDAKLQKFLGHTPVLTLPQKKILYQHLTQKFDPETFNKAYAALNHLSLQISKRKPSRELIFAKALLIKVDRHGLGPILQEAQIDALLPAATDAERQMLKEPFGEAAIKYIETSTLPELKAEYQKIAHAPDAGLLTLFLDGRAKASAAGFARLFGYK